MVNKKTVEPKCAVCRTQASKYRCSACHVRYCSVVCYKKHKAEDCSAALAPAAVPSSAPASSSAHPESSSSALPTAPDSPRKRRRLSQPRTARDLPSLKPLTDISWPPEPDTSIFMDPLKRDDPKPLRREELMRIATSPQLRQLLSTTSLPSVLRTLDSLPTPTARSRCLARLVGLDPQALSKPQGRSLVDQRDSPPPLEDLLLALAGQKPDRAADEEDEGWWLGPPPQRGSGADGTVEGTTKTGVWITGKEKEAMKMFAGVVVRAIEGDEARQSIGNGELSWEV